MPENPEYNMEANRRMKPETGSGAAPEAQDLHAEDPLLEEYVSQMSDQERLVMRVARDHLQSSFSLRKSVGFIAWMASR